MKKVVLFFAVSAAFAFASCNDANTNNNAVEATVDSVAEVVDTTVAAVVDSAVAVVDSTAEAVIDSVKALGEAALAE